MRNPSLLLMLLFTIFSAASYAQEYVSPAVSQEHLLYFDGIDDVVQITDQNSSLDLNDFTIEAWVYRMELDEFGIVVVKGAHGEDAAVNTNFALQIHENNRVQIIWENTGSFNFEVIGNTVIELNRWYHLAGTRSANENTLKLYVNGTIDAPPLATSGKPNNQDVPVLIGYNSPGFPQSHHFKGVVADVRVWSVARTAADIRASMAIALIGNEPGLAANWRLDEGSGQIIHDGGAFANHGTRGNSQEIESTDPQWLSSLPGPDEGEYALSFDGNDDIVTIPDVNGSLDLNDFTIEAWVYRSEFDNMGTIIHKGAHGEDPLVNTNYALVIREDNLARVIIENSNSINHELIGTTVIDAGTWYHLAGVRSAVDNTLKLYINGELDAPALKTSGLPNIQDIPVLLGFNWPGFPPDDHHRGLIDEVRIWNVPRSQEEIQAAMYKSLTGAEPGLVGYWRLDEGAGQVVHDLSPFSNHGYLGTGPVEDEADPQWVAGFSQCAGMSLPAAEAYGRINGGDQSHVDQVDYCFSTETSEAYLSFQAWDIDTPDEVDILLNGTKVFDLPLTANNAWSGLLGVLLPAELLQNAGNQLVFDNTRNPPKRWKWGVRHVSVDPFFALPSALALGRIHGGDQEHLDKVVYLFSGQPGDHELSYSVYDIDSSHEVDLWLNGMKLHDVAVTADRSWSESRTLLLPDEFVHDSGINVLVFDNTQNPPQRWFWGVREVRAEPIASSSQTLQIAAGAEFQGSGFNHAGVLLDGHMAPPARSMGDEGADSSSVVMTGATTIAPDGALTIVLEQPQTFSYMQVWPEWNSDRYFTIKVEASIDGQQWHTLVNRSKVICQGTQTLPVGRVQAKFLRLSGASFVQDVGLLHHENLEEEVFWQQHDDFVRKVVADSLGIVELTLLETTTLTSVDESPDRLPADYRLAQNFPNPFNPSTTIAFDLPQAAEVEITLYNVNGELVRTLLHRSLSGGSHTFTIDASDLTTGVYFYRLQANDFVATRKLLLAK